MKFYALKNNGAFRIQDDEIKRFIDEGYSIVDENFKPVENVEQYCTKEREKNGV